ncbi:heavy metal sensor histidine kinase [Geomonas sp. Red32]|uniref:heavy metal sensor histidine kinase n=1 Tax=Geomonas sp. Red32 TaxID=2912856 RepID=UPI00202CE744|nr:heavy metal sensor histidine kinase [Geomonas sp. Red32]MCM0083749.1 heavy metal sensor histidine kinase [Geomonas sp. Red32]
MPASASPRHPASAEGTAARPRRWSLTLRLACSNAFSFFILMSLVSTLLYAGLASQLAKQNHTYLHDEVTSLGNMIQAQREISVIFKELNFEHSGSEYVKHFIRVMDGDGALLMESPGMERFLPRGLFRIPYRDRPATDTALVGPDGRDYLTTLVWIDVDPRFNRRAVLQVALDVTNVREILVGYRTKIGLALALGFALCCGASFLIARQGTRSLVALTDTVRRITVTNLEERVGGDGWPSEIGVVADAINHMLDRMEDSFARLYRSASNLSHKMRTPLTILKGEAEVALSRPRSAEELEAVIASSLDEVTRLTRLADNILFLGNAELGKFSLTLSDLTAREEAEEVIDFYGPVAEEKGITLECRGDAKLVADRVLFRKSLAALISNAITYNSSRGVVQLSVTQGAGLACEISVADAGCGMAADQLGKIFDRFYRIYATRHMDPHGTGLGLPIAKAIMDLHQGSITVRSEPGRGTTVTLSYPDPESFPSETAAQG